MSLYKSAGLIDYWVSKYLNTIYLNAQTTNIGPRKLNLEQLLGGFEVWLIGCGFSALILFLEIIANKSMHRNRVQKAVHKKYSTHKNSRKIFFANKSWHTGCPKKTLEKVGKVMKLHEEIVKAYGKS